MGSFVFRWPHPNAKDVHVTGTFDDWSKSTALNKVGEIWEKEVDLPSAEDKILYKFVVDDDWVIDTTAPQESDGHGNTNNVLYPNDIKKKVAGEMVPEAVTTSSAAPQSTTAALAGQVPLEPAAGAKAAEAAEVAKPATESSLPGAFPPTPATEPDAFSVKPIPASEGIGNPSPGEATSNTVESTATTSKEDYENAGEPAAVGVKPIPASEGIGNPVNVPAGEKLPDPSEVTTHTVDSTVTTSKEDYEKAGSSVLPTVTGAIAGAGAAVAAGIAALSGDKKKENLIPESSLPMGSGAGSALDAGPTVSSAAPTSTTADLAGQVPLQETVNAAISSAAPVSTTAALAGQVPVEGSAVAPAVPEVVQESIEKAHQDPEAAASPVAVEEKSAVEKELLSKVPNSVEAGEPAPTIAAATSATAPAATADGAADPTLANEPAVQMMNQNEAESAAAAAPKPESTPAATAEDVPVAAATAAHEKVASAGAPEVKEEPKGVASVDPKSAAAPASDVKKDTAEAASTATETPKKQTTATPSTSSPATTPATKETKKKHRISAFFKKIFD